MNGRNRKYSNPWRRLLLMFNKPEHIYKYSLAGGVWAELAAGKPVLFMKFEHKFQWTKQNQSAKLPTHSHPLSASLAVAF